MYIVRDKKTRKVIHENPAPLEQKLKDKEVYFKFDAKKMEIGKTTAHILPEHFNINAKREIVELSLKEKIDAGIIDLDPRQKVANNQIVAKTTSELLKDGSLTLDEVKKQKMQHFSELSFANRRAILPDYKLQNAAIGIYDDQTAAIYLETIDAFRKEFHRIRQIIEKAKSLKQIEGVVENYPTKIMGSKGSEKGASKKPKRG